MEMKYFIFLCVFGLCNCLMSQIQDSASDNDLRLTVEKLVAALQPVAFTACHSKGDHLGDHQTLEYDQVVTNLGGGFDPRHSHFIAPVSGLYHFSATVMASQGSDIHVHIVKNGAELVRLYSAAASWESGSNEVNVHLEKSDMVWMQNLDNGAQLEPGLWNCFSGALTHADI